MPGPLATVGNAAGTIIDAGAGAADWVAGSQDEHVARTFDGTPGGGAADPAAWYDAAARAGDRGVGVFDEGAGGLISLVDSEGGNTAGSGQSPMFTFGASQADGQTGDGLLNGGVGQLLSRVPWVLVALFVGFIVFVNALAGGLAEGETS